MDKYDEIEFIYKLSLRNFLTTQEGFRCSCPVCGEGNSPHKRRCNILTKKYDWNQVSCFNCGLSTNFKTFLEMVDPGLFEEYKEKDKQIFLEQLKTTGLRTKAKRQATQKDYKMKYLFELGRYFVPAKTNRIAYEYCKKRKIDGHIDKIWYYTHEKSILSGMIIFPFFLEDQETCYGFMGRHTEHKNFHVHCKNDSYKGYNIFSHTNITNVIVAEAPIDSLCFDNAIAMVGADLASGVKEHLKDKNLIFCFDNDDTGLTKTKKYCNMGYDVFVWPKNIKEKDFNQMKINGYTDKSIQDIVDNNTFRGVEAKTRVAFKSLEKRKK